MCHLQKFTPVMALDWTYLRIMAVFDPPSKRRIRIPAMRSSSKFSGYFIWREMQNNRQNISSILQDIFFLNSKSIHDIEFIFYWRGMTLCLRLEKLTELRPNAGGHNMVYD